MFVNITPDEYNMLSHVALSRAIESIKKKRKDSVGKKDWIDDVTAHIVGCIGELAVAKALNLQWTGSVDTFKDTSDLPGGIEVRHRRNAEWDLIVRDADRDDRLYVLSRGIPPGVVEVVGWCTAVEAKRTIYLQDYGGRGRPAYFVPDSALRPISDLTR